jgi:aminoglycoside phosphotransferase (APT) family kinase protein
VEPVLGALLDWLEEHIPVQSPRRSLIHGDAAFSNLLVDGDRITAVLDWEAAHVGDAADELSYLKPSIEPVMPWSDFLDRYVTAGGLEPAPESMKFFEVWSHVWRHIGCLWLAQNFEQTGRYASAVAAYVHGPRFLAEGVKAAFS